MIKAFIHKPVTRAQPRKRVVLLSSTPAGGSSMCMHVPRMLPRQAHARRHSSQSRKLGRPFHVSRWPVVQHRQQCGQWFDNVRPLVPLTVQGVLLCHSLCRASSCATHCARRPRVFLTVQGAFVCSSLCRASSCATHCAGRPHVLLTVQGVKGGKPEASGASASGAAERGDGKVLGMFKQVSCLKSAGQQMGRRCDWQVGCGINRVARSTRRLCDQQVGCVIDRLLVR